MKRLAVILVLLLALTGCSEASVSKTSDIKEPKAEKAQPAKTEYAVGEAIQIDDLVFKVKGTKVFKSDNEFIQPDKGKVFLIVSVAMENRGEEKLDLFMTYKVEDANGVQNGQDYTDVPDALEADSLAPGGKVAGNIVFQVPKSRKGLKLVLEPNVFLDQQVKVILSK